MYQPSMRPSEIHGPLPPGMHQPSVGYPDSENLYGSGLATMTQGSTPGGGTDHRQSLSWGNDNYSDYLDYPPDRPSQSFDDDLLFQFSESSHPDVGPAVAQGAPPASTNSTAHQYDQMPLAVSTSVSGESQEGNQSPISWDDDMNRKLPAKGN